MNSVESGRYVLQDALRKHAWPASRSAAGHWPPVLGEHDEVELVQGIRAGRLYCEVRHRSRGDSLEEASRADQALAASLKYSLATAFPDYLFHHERDSACERTAPWESELVFRPNECRIQLARPIGPGVGHSSSGSLQLAVPRPGLTREYLQALLPLVGSSSHALEIGVTLRTRQLVEKELEVLRWASASVYAPGRLQAGVEQAWFAENQPILGALVQVIEAWLDRGCGYTVRLAVRSDGWVPTSLLLALPGEVLHGLSGRWTRAGNSTEAEAAAWLDLADCQPGGYPAPAIVPPPTYFAWLGATPLSEPAPGSLPDVGIILGDTADQASRTAVRFSRADRARHCYVVGATGTGKSTLLFNMVMQDIRNGEGVCVLDPHGDLQRDLAQSVPASRADDVIPIDLADPERAPGINLLESQGPGPSSLGFAINELLDIFWTLYQGIPEAMGPAFELYMRNTLLVIGDSEHGSGSVGDVLRFYQDPGFREHALSCSNNTAAVAFFRGLAQKTTGEHSLTNVAQYIVNKLNRFVGSDYVRPMIVQRRSTIHFRQCMDQRKVLLINLNKGLLGEAESRLAGMLLLTKLFAAALNRTLLPASARRPFHVYVDEAQNFTTPVIGSMMAEARKFGLTLTLANQHLGQWEHHGAHGILNSILGNAGSLLLFRVGPDDAIRLAPYIEPDYSTREAQYLPDRVVLAKMLAGGRPLPPFILRTRPPLGASDEGPQDDLVAARLRRNFEACSVPRAAIDTEWREAHLAAARTAPGPARKNQPGDNVA